MFELLLTAIALIGGFSAGIYDLITTNIPDKVCILMISSGIALHILNGFLTGDFTSLLFSLIFGDTLLIFSLLMYYFGQWGGGDGELLIAIGVLLPNLSFSKSYFPFAISFFINSFFVGVVYSILYVIIFAFKDRSVRRNFLKIFKSGFYKKIPVSKLKVDDMIGEDIPRLKIYKKFLRGLSKEEVKKIKKIKKYVIIREGIRYGIVFPLALLFTLFFGDFFFLFL